MAKLTLRSGDRDFIVETNGTDIVVDGTAVQPPPRAVAVTDGDRRLVFFDGNVYEFEVQRPGRRRTAAHQGSLTAPMPASVLRVNVAAGAAVKRGDTLLILEAMKMELPVRAPADGTVSAVHCKVGELVQPGVTLVEIA